MSNKTRVSTHHGRGGRNGAFSAKHNDRQFDLSKASHIDPTLTPYNRNIRFGNYGGTTNEEHELNFYIQHFSESLARKNKSYRRKSCSRYIKTMEEYYRSMQSCPEETLYTIGADADPALLWAIYLEHQAWAAEMYPQRYILDASMHVDEPNAMSHVHERVVWVGHDGHNMEVACQEKALREMGIPSPDPTRESNRYNNRKMVFSEENRNHFIMVCQAHGIDVELEPLPPSQVGLSIAAYKRMRMQEKLAASAQQLDMLERQFVSGEVADQSEDIKNDI